jgi:hypothetical protein
MRLGAAPVIRLERPLAHVKTPGSSYRSAGQLTSDRRRYLLTPTSIGRPRFCMGTRREVAVKPSYGTGQFGTGSNASVPVRPPVWVRSRTGARFVIKLSRHPGAFSPEHLNRIRSSRSRLGHDSGESSRSNRRDQTHSSAPGAHGHPSSSPTEGRNKLWSSPASPWRDSDTPGPREPGERVALSGEPRPRAPGVTRYLDCGGWATTLGDDAPLSLVHSVWTKVWTSALDG